MKKIILLFCLFILQHPFKAQVQDLWVADSINSCNQSGVSLMLYIGTIEEVDPLITVYWGDGTQDVINSGIYAANSYSALNVFHTYQTPGSYSIYGTIVSSVNSQLYTSNSIQTHYYGVNMCGHMYGNVYQTSNCGSQGNWSYNPVFDLTDANGNLTTFSGLLNGVDVTASPYTLSINDTWLMQNNLTQLTSDVTISMFDQFGWPDFNSNLSFQVGSLNLNQEPDYLFSNVYAYGLSPLEQFRLYLQPINQNCGVSGNTRVNLTFPSQLTPNLAGLLNPVLNGNNLSFDVTAFDLYSWIYIPFYMPGTTPAGTVFDFSANIVDLSTTELNASNNTINFSGIVYNSYDPNNKLVNKPESINPTVQDEFIYTINFQNEGNFNAINVKITDTLSENLDLSTFQVIHSKHNVVTSLNETTRIVEFRFLEVNLAPKVQDEEGSKGFVTYRVKEKENLPVNAEINNTAYIYFDFNPPIVTNSTHNVNTLLSVETNGLEQFELMPNPCDKGLYIKSEKVITRLILRDLNGKLMCENDSLNEPFIQTEHLVNGMYIVEVYTENEHFLKRVLVRH